ncbi:hypothetical protein FN846DRAFT_992278 [Sphaerosporella brunnea]|uniref:Uncharacterized protein n=1 Tax=Sphaerosporella brunnea TaxID=1250544 RepID=A0A5J5ENG5_9PEZI|nr:hypothetical protein FN846DRAFT_992278 [Sphaerosporella brunnea]
MHPSAATLTAPASGEPPDIDQSSNANITSSEAQESMPTSNLAGAAYGGTDTGSGGKLDRPLSPAGNTLSLLYRLPYEMHLEVASHLGSDFAAMGLALAGCPVATRLLLPPYIPRSIYAQRHLLVTAMVEGYGVRHFTRLVDAMMMVPDLLYSPFLWSQDKNTTTYTVFAPPRSTMGANFHFSRETFASEIAFWHDDFPEKTVGVINAAVGMAEIGIIRMLFAQIQEAISSEEGYEVWERQLLSRYPTPIHYACLYARPDILEWFLSWYATHATRTLRKIMRTTGPISGNTCAETPFYLAVAGGQFAGRSEEDVLTVLHILEPYPARHNFIGSHPLLELARNGYLLPESVITILLRRLPVLTGQLGQACIKRYLWHKKATGAQLEAMLAAGLPFPAHWHSGPISKGNYRLISWIVDNVPNVVCRPEHLWAYFLRRLPRANFIPLMELLGTLSKRFAPEGFHGQTLCLAILMGSRLAGNTRLRHEGGDIPVEWVWDVVRAMMLAGANVNDPWEDRCLRDTFADAVDLNNYVGWTASQMLTGCATFDFP